LQNSKIGNQHFIYNIDYYYTTVTGRQVGLFRQY